MVLGAPVQLVRDGEALCVLFACGSTWGFDTSSFDVRPALEVGGWKLGCAGGHTSVHASTDV